MNAAVARMQIHFCGEVVRKCDVHAAVTGLYAPICIHLRPMSDCEIDGSITGPQLQIIEPPVQVDTAIPAMHVHIAIEIVALDAAISSVGVNRPVQAAKPD